MHRDTASPDFVTARVARAVSLRLRQGQVCAIASGALLSSPQELVHPLSWSAQPLSYLRRGQLWRPSLPSATRTRGWPRPIPVKSEERRVGKECRCRGSRYHSKKKE